MEAYQLLEAEIGEWAGYPTENVVCCSSGTAALHLALEAFRLPVGSEVVIGDFNMIAVARAISLAGLTPVFVDCDEQLLMDWPLLVSAMTPKCSALMAVHIYGRRCDMDSLCKEYCPASVMVIEDLAEAHGVRPHPLTEAACWSFYRNKHVHGEEGGAVAFRDPVHAAHARELRSLGFTAAHDYRHTPRGHNYRLANLLAEPIRESLRQFDANRVARRQVEQWYDACCPLAWRMPSRDAVWVYDVQIPGLTRARQREIVAALNRAGIAARMSFLPMSEQEEYRSCRVIGSGNAKRLAECVLYLPVQPGVTTEADCQRTLDLLATTVRI